MIELIDKAQKRSSLHEGRGSGLSCGFAKRLAPKQYELVSPISACKDYLNDVVFTEKTGIRMPSTHGLDYGEKKDILGKKYAYLFISVLNSDKTNATKDEPLIETYKQNMPKIADALNHIEEKLGLPARTSIVSAGENLWLVLAPVFWAQETHRISFYTLLMRAAVDVKDPKKAITELAASTKSSGDTIMFMNIKSEEKLLDVLNTSSFDEHIVTAFALTGVKMKSDSTQEIGKTSLNYVIHNCGIMAAYKGE